MKLEHEKLLSNFAFNFNLRRYTEEEEEEEEDEGPETWYQGFINGTVGLKHPTFDIEGLEISVGRCRLTASKPVLKARLKRKCDEPLSNFAFNFNLRRYISASLEYTTRAGGDMTLRAELTYQNENLELELYFTAGVKVGR